MADFAEEVNPAGPTSAAIEPFRATRAPAESSRGSKDAAQDPITGDLPEEAREAASRYPARAPPIFPDPAAEADSPLRDAADSPIREIFPEELRRASPSEMLAEPYAS